MPPIVRKPRTRTLPRVILGVLLLVPLLALPVSANGPMPANYLSFHLTGLSSGIAYADILISISPEDPNYTPLNTETLERYGLSPECDMVTRNLDGFQSFTFHYKDAAASIEVNAVSFCQGTEYKNLYTQYEDLRKNYATVYLAFYDTEGTFVSSSEAITLPGLNGFLVFLGTIDYNYKTGEAAPSMYFSPWTVAFSMFFASVSIGIELLVALIFRIRRGTHLILVVNLISQTFMRAAYYGLIALSFPHLVVIIALEVIVFTTEFLVYRNSSALENESRTKLLVYTIAANTLSFAVVARMNGIGL
jgi:hypothetical protein